MNHSLFRYLIAFSGGAIGVFAFAPFKFWPAALISLFTLFFLISDEKSAKKSSKFGFLWGLGLFWVGVSWVYVSIQQFGGVSIPIAVFLSLLLGVYLSLFPALFGFILTQFFKNSSIKTKMIFIAPTLWYFTELFRGTFLTGFPWLQFGYSQLKTPLKQLAPIGGVELITLFLCIISGIFVISMKQKSLKMLISAFILFISPIFFSFIQWTKPDENRTVNIALVQGNTQQSIKWSKAYLNSILKTYSDLTLPLLGKYDLIIWPEAAIPDFEHKQQHFLLDLNEKAKENHSAILAGLMTYLPEQNAIFNSVIILGDAPKYSMNNKNRYNKYYLVPFGETVPFAILLQFIDRFLNIPMSNLTQGNYIQPNLEAKNHKLLLAICYEIIKGKQLRDNLQNDTDFIVTISNDAWFGKSIGPAQHFEMAQMRAVEFGRIVIRATNTGITGFIAPNGKTIKTLKQFEEGIISYHALPFSGKPFYAKYGYLIPIIYCTLVLVIILCNGIMVSWRTRRDSNP